MKLLKKIFCLKPLPTVLISVPSFALVIYVLAFTSEQTVISYVAYILSAYSLIILITGIRGIVLAVKNRLYNLPVVRKLYDIPVGKRYMEDAAFRIEVALYQGLVINSLYAAGKLASGMLYRSLWMVTLAVYYILLILLRSSLVHYVRRNSIGADITGEYRRYRMCGILLLAMNVALVGIVILIVHQNEYFYYPGYLIYMMALYAFYSIILAFINVIKYRKHGSPVMSAAKVISLTTAAVSMLSLTTAMIARFGDEDESFRQLMTSLVGGGVCAVVFTMAVYMIVHANKKISQLK